MERKKHERNKRYGVLIALLFINWAAIAAMIVWVDPENVKDILFTNSYLPMILLLAGGLFWLFSIIFMSARMAARWTTGVIIFTYLRIWGLGNLFNAILIFGMLTSLELFLWTKTVPHVPVAQIQKGD